MRPRKTLPGADAALEVKRKSALVRAMRQSKVACALYGSREGEGCERLLRPRFERLGENALAGRAFLQGQDGATVVVVNHRDVEPAPLLEQLNIAILVSLHVRQADQIEAGRHFDRAAG